MFSSVNSFGVSGIGGYGVEVEVYISNGLPGFDIVGLPDAAVKEARERVRAAIKNNVRMFSALILLSVLNLQMSMSLECSVLDRKSTRLNSSHVSESRMPSSA